MKKKVIHGKLNVGSPCVLFGEGAGNPKRSGCSALLWMKMIFVVIAVAASVCSAASFGRDSGTTYMKDALAPYVEKGELPGAVCILYNNGVVETTCIGYADVAAKRPITVNDVFAQCSQTKGFCGVTVAMLVEEGKISLDDPVSKYLPEFKSLTYKAGRKGGVPILAKAKNTLTIRMCLNHTGGFDFELPGYHAMGGWSKRMPLRSVAAMAAALPLLYDPGTKMRYSNVGIDVGAAVVEVVTGKRWECFLKERVLDPLGMKDTGFRPTDEQLKTKMELYEVRNGRPAKWLWGKPSMQRPFNDDRVFPSAGAGLWTTATDQYKFYKMLMNLGVGDNGVRILKEDTVKSLLAKSTRPKGMEGYSLGLGAPEEDGEDQWFGHGGARHSLCYVNWHKRQLKLWAVQHSGKACAWENARDKAAEKFFNAKFGNGKTKEP